MVLHIISDVVQYFSFDDINVDNWVFKLFYKGSFILFLLGSTVGILSQYFGEPISCDFKGMDSNMASDYCWIHGSSYIEKQYQKHMKCIVDLDGVESEDETPDTAYYQWVTFVMLIQAGAFIAPYKIWRFLEGGLMEEFGTEAKSNIMVKDRVSGEDVVMDAVVEKYVKYFRTILHRNTYYFGKYMFCEFLNFVVLFLNFWATDLFLNGKFYTYGFDVIHYNGLSSLEKKEAPSPFCQVFPLEVSCTVPFMGAGGGEANVNSLCVLSQNIINQKMYLIIWFWMTFLVLITPFCIVYRLCTLFFDCFRSGILMAQIGNTNDTKARNAIKFVLTKCYIGDWFVLVQVSKNVNMYFFRAFIKELKSQISVKKKPSFKASKDSKLDNNPLMKFTNDNHVDEDVEKGDDKSSLLLDKAPSNPITTV